jgi:hypothetical protein
MGAAKPQRSDHLTRPLKHHLQNARRQSTLWGGGGRRRELTAHPVALADRIDVGIAEDALNLSGG